MLSSATTTEHQTLLTGLALYEAYRDNDEVALASLIGKEPSFDSVFSLLMFADVAARVGAASTNTDTKSLGDVVRRRVVKHLAVSTG